jgi:hypothetical protein
MTTALNSVPRRYQPTPDECRRGGRAAAAKLTRAQRQAGGVQRSRQPSFIDLQRRRGRKGAQVVLARYGPKALAEILAQYYRDHPSSLELFVARQLQTLEIAFERERVVEIILATVLLAPGFRTAWPGPGRSGPHHRARGDLLACPGTRCGALSHAGRARLPLYSDPDRC